MTPVSERLCIVCPQLRAGSEPRLPEDGPVCKGCRAALPLMLADIDEAHAALPALLVRGVGSGLKVGGGDVEAALPFQEDVWDLMGPVQPPSVHDEFGDQVGNFSTATALHTWVVDWCEVRGKGEIGPARTVHHLALWLIARLPWACDHHPAVDDFAGEMRDQLAILRRYVEAGERRRREERCEGVQCKRCDRVGVLFRLSDGTGDVECKNPDCRKIYGPEEYSSWVKLLSSSARKRTSS